MLLVGQSAPVGAVRAAIVPNTPAWTTAGIGLTRQSPTEPPALVCQAGLPGTFAHEFGHCCGFSHAPCPPPPGTPGTGDCFDPPNHIDPRLPGRTEDVGFDVPAGEVIEKWPRRAHELLRRPLALRRTDAMALDCGVGSPVRHAACSMNDDDRDRDSIDCWIVRGLLFADNEFERQPGFTITDVPATDDRDSPLRVELLDTEGHVLLRAGISLAVPCTDGTGADPSFRLASGVVPLPAKTAAARFLVDDIVLEEYRFPEGEPVSAFTALPADGASGSVTVAWESRHPSDAPLTSVASYSSDDGASWQPLGLPTNGSEVDVDLDALAGGERCRVSVKTTDGVHTVTTVSEPFKLELRPCVAMILAPGPGWSLPRMRPSISRVRAIGSRSASPSSRHSSGHLRSPARLAAGRSPTSTGSRRGCTKSVSKQVRATAPAGPLSKSWSDRRAAVDRRLHRLGSWLRRILISRSTVAATRDEAESARSLSAIS